MCVAILDMTEQHGIIFFFFNDTATTEIYTLSLHDALPIYVRVGDHLQPDGVGLHIHVGVLASQPVIEESLAGPEGTGADRKSTRLNSSHANISYAVFCLKKKNPNDQRQEVSEGGRWNKHAP